MKRQILFFYCLFALLGLPSCRYVCWVTDITHQNQLYKDCYCCSLPYIRSLHIYEQFNTVAHFDAFWLSDEVRTTYAQLYADRRNLSPERYHSFLRRQLEENRHFISFYVLAVTPGRCSKALLHEKNAAWTISLEVNGMIYPATEIKLVELPPEYCVMFGKIWTRFKTPYLIKFEAFDVEGQRILTSDVAALKLIFTTICRDPECMVWELLSNGEIADVCIEPNVLAYDL